MSAATLQTLIVAALVLGALTYLVRTIRRTIAAGRASRSSGCADGCGCSPTEKPHR